MGLAADIKKATLADAWDLAWTGSLAFACESRNPWPKVRAVLGYPRHLAYILPAALEGSLWHRNRRVVVGIIGVEGQRNGYSHWVLAGLLLILLGPLDLTVLLVVLGI